MVEFQSYWTRRIARWGWDKFSARTVVHAVHLSLFAVLTSTIAPALNAQDSASEESALPEEEEEVVVPEADAPPQGVSYLLVTILGDAEMIGFPAVCPGSSPDENQSEILCLAELYEAPARVIQNLGGERTERRLNIRFTAHSFSAVWRKDVRFLLGVRPFEDKGRTGHFAWWWDWENDDGEFCEGTEDLKNFDEPVRNFFARGRSFTAGPNDEDWSEGYSVTCVKGRRPREL